MPYNTVNITTVDVEGMYWAGNQRVDLGSIFITCIILDLV